jgi:CBS domain-containing protein
MGTTVRDVMTNEVIAVKSTAEFKEIALVLRQHHVSACPVISDEQRVVGVVSEADLLYKAADCELPAGLIRLRWKLGEDSKITATTAGQLMTSPAVTIHPDAPVAVAARVMRDQRLKRLPVVNPDGTLIGIVSRVDLLSLYDRPDADIFAEVMKITNDEFGPDHADIDVTVSDGVVTLAGFAVLQKTALELEARIRHVEGVVAVRDRLIVGELID